MTEENLYELTGNILHINILLVHRADLNKLVADAETALSSERERCAKVVEQDLYPPPCSQYQDQYNAGVMALANKIRSSASQQPANKYNPAPVYTSNCIRHPGAPHGVDVDASWRAGKTVCMCQSWAPGDAS